MSRRPNIILIVADDMGYGDCGCFGSTEIATPNIDSIAARGIRFTDFHSNGAVCSPTRAALLTGRYQQRCGIEGVITSSKHRDVGMSLDETTFADVMAHDGYRTAIFGKWHLGYAPEFNPTQQGFDVFRGFVSGNVDYISHIDQVGKEDWWSDGRLAPEDGYTTDLVTEHGVGFITEHQEEPFCLYLAHECPHYPYQGPTDSAYRTPGSPGNPLGPRADQMAAYVEMMACLDRGIGGIVRTVESLGLTEDTLILFFSDNGPAGPGSAGALRGGKGTLWEGGHRVPAAACWPGTIPPGTVSTAPCIGMDLFPTMLSAAGVGIPSALQLDGMDLMPLLLTGEELPERDLFWRHGAQKAVRSGRWKLIETEGQGAELFDLSSDIGEREDLAPLHPDTVSELKGRISLWEADVTSERRLT